ncbi:MAG: hypothetical protein QM831_07895 [Kofleriaceae bacterium]
MSAQLGAGAQGSATYGAFEARYADDFDRDTDRLHVGLGVRAVWDDGVFRRSDWASPFDAVSIIRDVELVHPLDDGHLALAAGALSPSRLGRIADGYRSTLDDHWRTGVRSAAVTQTTQATLEIDDVLDPAMIGGAVDVRISDPYAMHVAFVMDPQQPTTMDATRVAGVLEAGASRQFTTAQSRTDTGFSLVSEFGLGFSFVGYAQTEIQRDDVRYTARADLREGSGTSGAMFGPLYRVERATLWQRAHDRELDGLAGGGSVGMILPRGWFEVGLRERPGLGLLGTAYAGMPMNAMLQAGVWAAVSRDDSAGAAEVRVAWARQLYSALQAARIYQFDTMTPQAIWSLTAWFGVTN